MWLFFIYSGQAIKVASIKILLNVLRIINKEHQPVKLARKKQTCLTFSEVLGFSRFGLAFKVI